MAEPKKKKKKGGRAVSDADVLPLEDVPNNKLPPMKNDPLESFKKFMKKGQNEGDITDTFLLEKLKKEAKKKDSKELKEKLERLMGQEKAKGGSVKKKAKGGSVKKYARGGGVRAARY